MRTDWWATKLLLIICGNVWGVRLIRSVKPLCMIPLTRKKWTDDTVSERVYVPARERDAWRRRRKGRTITFCFFFFHFQIHLARTVIMFPCASCRFFVCIPRYSARGPASSSLLVIKGLSRLQNIHVTCPLYVSDHLHARHTCRRKVSQLGVDTRCYIITLSWSLNLDVQKGCMMGEFEK